MPGVIMAFAPRWYSLRTSGTIIPCISVRYHNTLITPTQTNIIHQISCVTPPVLSIQYPYGVPKQIRLNGLRLRLYLVLYGNPVLPGTTVRTYFSWASLPVQLYCLHVPVYVSTSDPSVLRRERAVYHRIAARVLRPRRAHRVRDESRARPHACSLAVG